MASINKLTAAAVKAAKPGMYGDGGGLWLQVQGVGQASWLFRYTSPTKRTAAGKPAVREMGLGSAATVTLAQARDRAAELRQAVSARVDPIEARDATKAAEADPKPVTTFRAATEAYVEAHRAGWRNAKHAAQWVSTLKAYAYPRFGTKPVSDVTADDVLAVLDPIWRTVPETAVRVRGRIESVLDYAVARQWRPDGPNPAQWRGRRAKLLPARGKVRQVRHHAALPWAQAPAFMAELAGRPGTAAAALRLAIYTVARSGEVRGATWAEIDMDNALWTVTGTRMKAGKEHRVPLSESALAILHNFAALRTDDDPGALMFPGQAPSRPLSDMTLTTVLRRMGRGDVTAHRFRSTFRDWAAETGRPADIAEAALAHVVGSKTAIACQRGDLLARRRVLMQDWAHYLQPPVATAGQTSEPMAVSAEGVPPHPIA